MKFSRRRTIAAVAGLSAAGAAGWAARAALARYYDGPVSDHFDGTHFFDPHGTPPKGIIDMLRWWSGPAKTQWPVWAPSPFADRPPARGGGSARRRLASPLLLRRPRQPAHPDRRPQFADRPGVVGARLAVQLRRAQARQRSGRRVRRAAGHRRGAG